LGNYTCGSKIYNKDIEISTRSKSCKSLYKNKKRIAALAETTPHVLSAMGDYTLAPLQDF
jgi:hypothetical protein